MVLVSRTLVKRKQASLAVYLNNELTELWYGLYQQVKLSPLIQQSCTAWKQAFILAKEKLKAGLSVAIAILSTD